MSLFPSAVLTSGGRQTGLPQHLQDHGLRGLLQVSPVGETAGECSLTIRSAVSQTVYYVWRCAVLLCCDLCRSLSLSLCHQTQGLGTSLKILFSERQIEALPASSDQRPSFQLSRQEIVSLLNAFGR